MIAGLLGKNGMKVLFETDWVNFTRCFYNVKTGQFGTCINDVIDRSDIEIDRQGLQDYLDFGYCVFGHTPVKHVRFLPHSSQLLRRDDGSLEVRRLEDKALQSLDSIRWSEDEIWDYLRDSVQRWEDSVDREIVIPTSGGYDSRILNWMIRDKTRIRSFTFGASFPQAHSFEVVYARELSKRLETQWEHIELGDFFRYMEDWYDLYGVSVHAHGMAHFEFYDSIRAHLCFGHPENKNVFFPVLSGVLGDDWAGADDIPQVLGPGTLSNLGLRHGMCIDVASCMEWREHSEARQSYWDAKREMLCEPKFRVLEMIRHKQMLFSYLFRVPEKLGFLPWTPFRDLSLAAAMLNLSPRRKTNRLWQQDFFRKNNIMVNDYCQVRRLSNTLFYQAYERMPLQPLDKKILSEVIRPDYVEWVNRYVSRTPLSVFQEAALSFRGAGRLCKMFAGRIPTTVRFRALMAYLVLYPIERLLKSRS